MEDGEETGKALDTGDQVEFSVLLNRKLGTSVAESVKLLCKAEDKRELGQVCDTLPASLDPTAVPGHTMAPLQARYA